MYPFEDGQTFPRNQWYIAACSQEVGRTLFERTILGEPVVLYRTEDGRAVALDGICPHRNLPLVQGRLDGDAVRCGYHGFRFESDGRCSEIPSQPSVPVRFATRAYPVLERWQWIWVWTGDPDKADPALLPDIAAAGIGVPGWRADSNGVFQLRARFSLLIDNLMDLSHIAYLHARTLGRVDLALVPAEITEADRSIRVSRRMTGLPAESLPKFMPPAGEGPIDLTLYSDFLGPGLINAAGPHCARTATGEPLGRVNFVHGLTPETLHSTHYFPAVARDFQLHDDALSQALLAQEAAVLQEDIGGLELVEKAVQRRGDTRRELSALVDAGAIRVRRRLVQMMQAERPA